MKNKKMRKLWTNCNQKLSFVVARNIMMYYAQVESFFDEDCKKIFIKDVDLNDPAAVEKESLKLSKSFFKNDDGNIVPLFVGVINTLQHGFYKKVLSKFPNDKTSLKNVRKFFSNNQEEHLSLVVRNVFIGLVWIKNTREVKQ